MTQHVKAAPESNNGPALEPGKEIELLVKSIEEASKHCREVLIVLLLTSCYILVAVFSSRATDSVQLPLLSFSVSNSLFLAVGPLLVVVPYLYLQICVSDLRERLRAFEGIEIHVQHVPFPGLLLFPFVITRGLLRSPSKSDSRTPPTLAQRPDYYHAYLLAVTVALVWILAPSILLTLWLRFIDRQQIESLIPCAALIAVIYGSSGGASRSRFSAIFGAVVSLALIVISFASVASVRNNPIFLHTWELAQAIGQRVSSHSTRATGAASRIAAYAGILIFGLQLIANLFLYENETRRLETSLEALWIRLEDRKGLLNKIASRLLYTAVASRFPLRILAVVIGITVSIVTYLVVLLI